ncbi:MAG: hemerythrin domain-containing protein [Candidatus Methylomirabilales bacterium]
MKPTEILREEHRVIERVLVVLERAAARLEQGEEIPADLFLKAVEFIRGFADHCHHGKEEGFLFPFLERRGIPKEGGPIGVMLSEHDEGRRWVKLMDDAGARYRRGENEARRDLIEAARGYSQLLRRHIDKEDHVLFPMADQILPEKDQADLVGQFEAVEREGIGEEAHARFLNLAGELKKMVA